MAQVDNPYTPPKAPLVGRFASTAGADTAELTFQKALSIWWSLAWRTTLGSIVAGALLGAVGGVIVGLAGQPQLGGVVGAVLGWLVSIPVSMWALYAALGRKHGGYRVALVRSD